MQPESCRVESQCMESCPVRVLLVDDHSVMRDGLRLMLEGSGEFEVAGQARDGEEAVSVAADVSPDVVVMDVVMPKKDGVEACREIMESAPETRVVMLTASTEVDAIVEAVAAGATGYLQKETDRERLQPCGTRSWAISVCRPRS